MTAAEPAAPFTQDYETLGAWVLSRPRPLPGPPGLAVLVCRGLPAWLAACPTWQAATAGPKPLLATPTAALPPTAVAHAALTLVLATMIISVQREAPA